MKNLREKKYKILSVTAFLAALGAVALGSVWALQPQGQNPDKKIKKQTSAAEKKGKEDCEISKEDRKKVLAKIGDAVITVGDFADEINKKSPYLRARYESMDKKKDLLKSMVRRELLAAEAAKRGFEKNADVQRSMKQVMIQKLLNHTFEERVKKAGIPEEELKKFYQDHIKEYDKPEQVRVSHILVADMGTAKKVKEEADKKGSDMRAWRELVRKYSTDKKTKVRGGDLRYFPEDAENIQKEIIVAAFKMEKPGTISGPIKTKEGFHIIRLTHRRKAFKRTFDEVKDQIEQRILRRKRSEVVQSYVKELREKAKLEINDEELKTLKVDTRTPVRGRAGGRGGKRLQHLRKDMKKRRRGGKGKRGMRGGRGPRRRRRGGGPGMRRGRGPKQGKDKSPANK